MNLLTCEELFNSFIAMLNSLDSDERNSLLNVFPKQPIQDLVSGYSNNRLTVNKDGKLFVGDKAISSIEFLSDDANNALSIGGDDKLFVLKTDAGDYLSEDNGNMIVLGSDKKLFYKGGITIAQVENKINEALVARGEHVTMDMVANKAQELIDALVILTTNDVEELIEAYTWVKTSANLPDTAPHDLPENGLLVVDNVDGDPITSGVTFRPYFDGNVLKWTNDGGLPNPEPFEIKSLPVTIMPDSSKPYKARYNATLLDGEAKEIIVANTSFHQVSFDFSSFDATGDVKIDIETTFADSAYETPTKETYVLAKDIVNLGDPINYVIVAESGTSFKFTLSVLSEEDKSKHVTAWVKTMEHKKVVLD